MCRCSLTPGFCSSHTSTKSRSCPPQPVFFAERRQHGSGDAWTVPLQLCQQRRQWRAGYWRTIRTMGRGCWSKWRACTCKAHRLIARNLSSTNNLRSPASKSQELLSLIVDLAAQCFDFHQGSNELGLPDCVIQSSLSCPKVQMGETIEAVPCTETAQGRTARDTMIHAPCREHVSTVLGFSFISPACLQTGHAESPRTRGKTTCTSQKTHRTMGRTFDSFAASMLICLRPLRAERAIMRLPLRPTILLLHG